MHNDQNNQDQLSHVEHTQETHWTLRSVPHMIGALWGFWSSDLNRAAVDLIDPQPGTTLLDIGAGLGPATIEAAHRIGPNGRVIAVDPSRMMRGALRLRRLSQRTRRLIDVRAGTAEQLPIGTGSIDAVWAINAAHHFNEFELAAAELARVITPGGRVLLIDEDFTNPNHPYNQHRSDTDGPEPFDVGHFVDLLSATGLTVTYADHHPIAGTTATIINATAAQRPASEAGQDHPHPGERS